MARLLSISAAILAVVGSAHVAVAQVAEHKGQCALRDLHASILVEDHGEASSLSPDQLYGLALVVIEARKACEEGRFGAAKALYDVVLMVPSSIRTAKE